MVNYQSAALDRTFSALADPTRRAMLHQLEAESVLSVSALARPFAIKLPAVLKHLGVLEDAGLIERSKAGRIVSVALAPGPMEDAMSWLKHYERFWNERLERLVAFAEAEETKAK